MKIIFIEAVQNFGGARKSTIELAARLQKHNHLPIIIDFWGCNLPFIKALEQNELRYEIIDKRDSPFIISNPNTFITRINYLKYFRLIVLYRKKLKILFKMIKPDLIIVNNTKTLSIIPRSRKYKICFFARGWFLPNSTGFMRKLLIKKMTDIYIAVSHPTRHAIHAGGFAKLSEIFVVPNAFDFSFLKNNPDLEYSPMWFEETENRPFTIMHCGGFLPSKGQHLLPDIAVELAKKNINFKFLLVGLIYKGSESKIYYDNIVNEIKEKNLQKYFKIIPDHDNILNLFGNIDILIHPSSTEGLPRVVMEAMAFGKPVIGNAVGGVTDFVIHGFTGYITNHNSLDEYVYYCSLLEKDKIKYKFLSENASSLIRECYTIENQLDHFSKINNNN